jgi:flagellar hook-associated protein 3 FlgL
MGRISTAQIFQNAQGGISAAREKEVTSSEKASTGKELVRPSQNPGGFVIASNLKDELAQRESIAKNASLALNVLTMHESIFSQVQEIAQRAHELAVSAAGDDGASEAARKLSLQEADNLYDSALQSLNMRYGNRTLLAGYSSQGPAFDNLGNFLGDNGEIKIEIAPGQVVPISIPAGRAILGVGLDRGINVLEVLKRFADGMRTNNTEMVRSSLEDLEKANDQMSLMRAEVGARQDQIRQALQSHEDSKINMTEEISKVEDADAVKVFSDLSRDQTVLKAAISTSDKLLSDNPTALLFK